jgi:hypothetical protein
MHAQTDVVQKLIKEIESLAASRNWYLHRFPTSRQKKGYIFFCLHTNAYKPRHPKESAGPWICIASDMGRTPRSEAYRELSILKRYLLDIPVEGLPK